MYGHSSLPLIYLFKAIWLHFLCPQMPYGRVYYVLFICNFSSIGLYYSSLHCAPRTELWNWYWTKFCWFTSPKAIALRVQNCSSSYRARKQFVWFWVHCAKIVEYIRWTLSSNLYCYNIRWRWQKVRATKTKRIVFRELTVARADQKIVGNSFQPIGVIITGNLFIKGPCRELQ